jgi:hypothetical protein
MDSGARALLERLLSSGEKLGAGVRSRRASLTKSSLADYRDGTVLEAKENFEQTMQAAVDAGAVGVRWESFHGEKGFIERIDLVSAAALAAFLGVEPLDSRLARARALLSPLYIRYPVLPNVIERWEKLKNVRGMGPDSMQDWFDATVVIDRTRAMGRNVALSVPIREASARIFKDSKRIEKLASACDVLLLGSLDAEIRDPESVWQEIGLFREENPVRMAGKIFVERDRVVALLDTPYGAMSALSVARLVSLPELVMTIENLTTFHSEARLRCDDTVLLIYTGGMPSPSWRAMYRRLLLEIPNNVPLYHWGDIDEGGFRIAARLAKDAKETGHALLPWRMSPEDVPLEIRRPAKPSTLERIQYFAAEAGWGELGEALAAAGFTVEQEGL